MKGVQGSPRSSRWLWGRREAWRFCGFSGSRWLWQGECRGPQVFRQWALLLACVVTGDLTCTERAGRGVELWKCSLVRPCRLVEQDSFLALPSFGKDTGQSDVFLYRDTLGAKCEGVCHPGHSQAPGETTRQGQWLRRPGTIGNVRGGCSKRTWTAEAGREIGV